MLGTPARFGTCFGTQDHDLLSGIGPGLDSDERGTSTFKWAWDSWCLREMVSIVPPEPEPYAGEI